MVGALFALLALGLVLPAQTHAGCGYRSVLSHPLDPAIQGDPQALLEQILEALDRGLPDSPAQDVPCSGPMCSRAPALPTAPILPASVNAEEWGWMAPALFFHTSQTSANASGDGPHRPVRRSPTIDRPPRS